jgi:Gas vesicle synthesis protein GvpL/GvpF
VPDPESAVIYVYAIANERVVVDDLTGISGEPLRIVSIGACHAIVGTTSTDEHAPPSADVLRAQDALVRTLATRASALLPARFGSRFVNEATLRDALDAMASRLEQALARVRGCEQMTIRAFAADTLTEILPASPVASSSSADLASDGASESPGPGTRYLRQRASELRVLPPSLDRLRHHLSALIHDERIETGRAPVIGSIHHLIPRGTADAYRHAVREAEASAEVALATSGIRIRVSGPSPAYAFAEVGLP